MQVGDKIEVACVYSRITSPAYSSMPFELGGRGNAVKLYGISYHIDYFVVASTCYLYFALSSNPTHELTPPGNEDIFWADQALYGFAAKSMSSQFGAADYGAAAVLQSQYVPLYGIIRPRRIIFVAITLHLNYSIRTRAELYYEPVELGGIELDTLNRKYGRYRRT